MREGDHVTDNRKWYRGVGKIVHVLTRDDYILPGESRVREGIVALHPGDVARSEVEWRVVWGPPIRRIHDNAELTVTSAPLTPVTMSLYRRLYLALSEM